MKKGGYFIVGSFSLIAGIIGIALPVIPTTPFILLSGWCFIRSSDKVYTWLIQNETFGKTIEDYQTGKGIKKRTKIKAISLMWITISLSIVFYVLNIYIRGIMLITAILVSNYIIKQPTAE